jgi:hypothetical protein
MLTSNMSGGFCAATRLTSRIASPGARAPTRTLRPKPPMLLAFYEPGKAEKLSFPYWWLSADFLAAIYRRR